MPAVYWSQKEQEEKLAEAYEKWARKGGVWSAAAPKVSRIFCGISRKKQNNDRKKQTHLDQMNHVKKGCLARLPDDARSDGSRIEASHRQWNLLQKSFASGLEHVCALGHDHVLRRNCHVVLPNVQHNTFTNTTYGSHHVRLVSHNAGLFNRLITKLEEEEKLPQKHKLKHIPELQLINSGEIFGLVPSEYTNSFKGLLEVKEESKDESDPLPTITDHDVDELMSRLQLDPQLLALPIPATKTISVQVTPGPKILDSSTVSQLPNNSGNNNDATSAAMTSTNLVNRAKRKAHHTGQDSQMDEAGSSTVENQPGEAIKKVRLESVDTSAAETVSSLFVCFNSDSSYYVLCSVHLKALSKCILPKTSGLLQ